jgi:hypothetical protein
MLHRNIKDSIEVVNVGRNLGCLYDVANNRLEELRE